MRALLHSSPRTAQYLEGPRRSDAFWADALYLPFRLFWRRYGSHPPEG